MNLKYKIGNQLHDIYYISKNYNQISKDIEKLQSDKKLLYLFDKNISQEIRNKVISSLKFSGCKVYEIEFIGNKKNKSLKAVLKIIDFMISKGFTRKSIILSMGGGVLGDLSALAASLYMRGILYFHIPTTMTSMVDSSIGGKTAVNLTQGKNLIGAFHQPNLIVMDTKSLSTLNQKEMNSGWAEAIKHSLLFDNKLFEKFKNHSSELLNKGEPFFTDIIKRSVEIKAEIVSKDEFETGTDRIKLNFGHTIGHALETATSYNSLLHGEAVSIGMVVASKISSALSYSGDNLTNEIQNILEVYNLPTRIPENIDLDNLYTIAKSDKKVRAGKINWVLLKKIGESVIVNDVPKEIVMDSLRSSQ